MALHHLRLRIEPRPLKNVWLLVRTCAIVSAFSYLSGCRSAQAIGAEKRASLYGTWESGTELLPYRPKSWMPRSLYALHSVQFDTSTCLLHPGFFVSDTVTRRMGRLSWHYLGERTEVEWLTSKEPEMRIRDPRDSSWVTYYVRSVRKRTALLRDRAGHTIRLKRQPSPPNSDPLPTNNIDSIFMQFHWLGYPATFDVVLRPDGEFTCTYPLIERSPVRYEIHEGVIDPSLAIRTIDQVATMDFSHYDDCLHADSRLDDREMAQYVVVIYRQGRKEKHKMTMDCLGRDWELLIPLTYPVDLSLVPTSRSIMDTWNRYDARD